MKGNKSIWANSVIMIIAATATMISCSIYKDKFHKSDANNELDEEFEEVEFKDTDEDFDEEFVLCFYDEYKDNKSMANRK